MYTILHDNKPNYTRNFLIKTGNDEETINLAGNRPWYMNKSLQDVTHLLQGHKLFHILLNLQKTKRNKSWTAGWEHTWVLLSYDPLLKCHIYVLHHVVLLNLMHETLAPWRFCTPLGLRWKTCENSVTSGVGWWLTCNNTALFLS